MFKSLIIGNQLIHLSETDSTNSYLQQLLLEDKNRNEGLVVVADKQNMGRGQRGNLWISEPEKNLTFSIFLKPNLLVVDQFLMSKLISLGIADYLIKIGLRDVKIKWPNDIYCGKKKISGILIENAIRHNKISTSIVGIGLNVNQKFMDTDLKNPTSLSNEINIDLNLDNTFNELLSFIDKRYLMLKTGKVDLINKDYHKMLYRLGELTRFKVNGNEVEGTIIGTNPLGKLCLQQNIQIQEYDLKEIEFLI